MVYLPAKACMAIIPHGTTKARDRLALDMVVRVINNLIIIINGTLYLVRVVICRSVQTTSQMHMRIYNGGLEPNLRNGYMTVNWWSRELKQQ